MQNPVYKFYHHNQILISLSTVILTALVISNQVASADSTITPSSTRPLKATLPVKRLSVTSPAPRQISIHPKMLRTSSTPTTVESSKFQPDTPRSASVKDTMQNRSPQSPVLADQKTSKSGKILSPSKINPNLSKPRTAPVEHSLLTGSVNPPSQKSLTTIPSAKTTNSTDNQSLDDWMPNHTLQQAVLTSLKNQLHQNSLTLADITPTTIKYLKHLDGVNTYIKPDNSDLTRPQKEFSLKGLDQASNLETLHLHQLDDLQNLTGNLFCNVQSLEPLRNLKHLQIIDFRGNQVQDIDPLKNLTELKEIDAQFNEIANFSSLKDLVKNNPSLKLYYGQQFIYRDDPVIIKHGQKVATLESKCIDATGNELPLEPPMAIDPSKPSMNTDHFSKVMLNKQIFLTMEARNGSDSDRSHKMNFNQIDSDLSADERVFKNNKNGLNFTGMTSIAQFYAPSNSKFLPIPDKYYLIGAINQIADTGATQDALIPNFIVIQRYFMAPQLTVQYRDETGKPILGPDGQPFSNKYYYGRKENDDYNFAAQTIPGWILGHKFSWTKNTPRPTIHNGQVSGTFARRDSILTLYYQQLLDGGDITVNYQDSTGEPLTPPVPSHVISGKQKLNESIKITALTIPNYLSNQSSKTVTFTKTAQTVTFTYRRKSAADITLHYQDNHGNSLDNPIVVSGQGKLGLTLPAPDQRTNFHLTGHSGDTTFTTTAHDVTYLYTRDDAQDVIVNYQDDQGNQLHSATNLPGREKLGVTYQTKPITITGFQLIGQPSNASGIFSTRLQTVVYIYQRADGAPVSVHYQDTTGHALATDSLLTGKYGQTFDAPILSFPSYMLDYIHGSANGTFTNQPQSVTFVYDKIPAGVVTVHYQDNIGNRLYADQHYQGQLGNQYATTELNIPGYTFNQVIGKPVGYFTVLPQTVTYLYTRSHAASVTVHFVDQDQHPLRPVQMITGILGQKYQTSPVVITGHHLMTVLGAPQGFFTDHNQTVIYIYALDQSHPQPTVKPTSPVITKPNPPKTVNVTRQKANPTPSIISSIRKDSDKQLIQNKPGRHKNYQATTISTPIVVPRVISVPAATSLKPVIKPSIPSTQKQYLDSSPSLLPHTNEQHDQLLQLLGTLLALLTGFNLIHRSRH